MLDLILKFGPWIAAIYFYGESSNKGEIIKVMNQQLAQQLKPNPAATPETGQAIDAPSSMAPSFSSADMRVIESASAAAREFPGAEMFLVGSGSAAPDLSQVIGDLGGDSAGGAPPKQIGQMEGDVIRISALLPP